MATYKVLQDIEAEDTLVGPLTLRQCIYAAIALTSGWLSFLCISKGVGFLAVFLFPFILFGAFFAFPWSKQQTTEIWALAKIRFYIKPRKRIWDQTGVRQQVTITAPKRPSGRQARKLSPDEVQNRLRALADTIDSRGWAVKNIELGYYTKPSVMTPGSDRLIDPNAFPQEVPAVDPDAGADIFDVANNPIAQKFNSMVSKADAGHRQQLEQQLNNPQPAPAAYGQQAPITNYWHMKTIEPPHDQPLQSRPPAMPTQAIRQPQPVAAPPASQNSQSNPAQYNGPSLSLPKVDYGQMRTPASHMEMPVLQPIPTNSQTAQKVTDITDPVTLELAYNNDLNVATLAREAQARKNGPNAEGEVVVNLHS